MLSSPPPHSSKKLYHLHVAGKYMRLIECGRENRDHLLREYGFEHQYVAIATLDLARWLYDQRDYAAAERELRECMVTDVADRDDLKKRNATCFSDLAQLYLTSGRYSDAEAALDQAAALMSAMPILRLRSIAATSLHRARLHMYRGDFAQAEQLINVALELTEKEFGPKHRKLGVILDILSQLYHRQDKTSEAEQTIHRALNAYQARESAQYAWSLYQLARYVAAQGRLPEAKTCLAKGLEILKRVRPSGHSDIVEFEKRHAEIHVNT